MQPSPASPNAVRFGLFEADLSAAELRKRGRKMQLQDQPFRVLALLLRRPGELVTREEFQQELWSADTFVEFDEGLNKAIQKLRQALDDSSDNPRFIETLPRKGYRFIAPVESIAGGPSATTMQEPAKGQRRHVLAWALFGVVSLALVILAGVHFQFLRPASRLAPKPIPFTSYPGQQITPAFSPDGKQVAFAWDGEKGDNFDIYVKLVNAGAPLRLTSNPASEFAPTWSPDGRYIAFCRESPDSPPGDVGGWYRPLTRDRWRDRIEIWMIPALGGAERKLGESTGWRGLSWSPDGKFLALVDKSGPQAPYSIFLLSVETGNKQRLTSPPDEFLGDFEPHFSPDGKTVAFLRSHSFWADDLYEVPVTSVGRPAAEPRRLTFDERRIFGLDWTADGRRIVFSPGYFGRTDLWLIPESGGTPERLAVVGENAAAISISRTGSRLIYTRLLFNSNIWRIPGPNSTDRRSTPTKFIASTQVEQEPQFSPDGQSIAFSSARSGNYEIWICDGEGRNPVQLTSFGGPPPGSPRWSPDGRWIAFDSPKPGNFDIYTVSANGGPPRRLTTGPSSNIRPSWSKDGWWIYFGSNRSGDWQIWKAPAQGGAAVRVTKKGGEEAFESSDGKFVYYAKLVAPGIWKVPVEGGEETQVLEQGGRSIWALTDQGMYFFDLSNSEVDRFGIAVPRQPAGSGLSLNLYNPAAGKVTLVRQFPKETRISGAPTVSPDGRWILYTKFDQAGRDLMLVENFR